MTLTTPTTYQEVLSGFKDWQPDAACIPHGPQAFFSDSRVTQRDVATQVCGTCPVRLACLQYALVCEETHIIRREGVWGGLTAWDRKPLVELGRVKVDSWPIVSEERLRALLGELAAPRRKQRERARAKGQV